ncbi:hypothetical protein DITRI_Ditri13aG0054900 [Diplodiscus trichospermus]
MFLVAAFGLVVNVIVVLLLGHDHGHGLGLGDHTYGIGHKSWSELSTHHRREGHSTGEYHHHHVKSSPRLSAEHTKDEHYLA